MDGRCEKTAYKMSRRWIFYIFGINRSQVNELISNVKSQAIYLKVFFCTFVLQWVHLSGSRWRVWPFARSVQDSMCHWRFICANDNSSCRSNCVRRAAAIFRFRWNVDKWRENAFKIPIWPTFMVQLRIWAKGHRLSKTNG